MEAFFQKALVAAYFFVGLAWLVGLFRFRQLNTDQRILFALICVAVVTEVCARILWNFQLNNLFLYNLYIVIEFLLLCLIYSHPLAKMIHVKYFYFAMGSFVLFAVVNALFFQSPHQFNSHVNFTECLLLMLLAILFFYQETRDLVHRHLLRTPLFWINASVITYFSGALVLFYVANDIIPMTLKERGVVWGVHALFNIVHYALYTVALTVNAAQEKVNT
ncbi:MAG: hypothetical protein ACOVMQ_08125 [Cyclobacteriaceae bacterium]|jgi:hypothetical protein